MTSLVVYVHGLWLPGGEAFLLRRRLARQLGAATRAFSYPSVRSSFADNAASLGRFLHSLPPTDHLHLVAHSMGGLIILKMFDLRLAEGLPPGRIVLTGSPVRGSRSAERLAQLPFGRAMLGETATEALLTCRRPRWEGGRELGVIAGVRGVGLGRLLGPIDAPNDGTIWAEETDLPGAAQQIRLRVSHSGMLFSAELARQAAAFLRTGRFLVPG